MKKIALLLLLILPFLIMRNVEAGPGLCRVTTLAPNLVTNKDVPCSIDTLGNIRFTMGTTQAGEDVANDVQKVEQRYAYKNIVLAAPTTTLVKSGPGVLHVATFNKPASTGTLTCYDNTLASGTVIATVTSGDAIPKTLHYDVAFALGLTCVTATAAQDVTLSYR